MALPVNHNTVANVDMLEAPGPDFRFISPLQILGLERLEVRHRLRAVLVVKVMPNPVAECAAIPDRDLQSEMQARLCVARSIAASLICLFIRFVKEQANASPDITPSFRPL